MIRNLHVLHVNEVDLDDPSGIVTKLQILSTDKPPLILTGNRCKLATMLTQKIFFQFLTQEERARMELFCHLSDRQRFAIGRIMLRAVLGCWFSVEPYSVILNIGSRGKPYCQDGPFFNISHSGDCIALAIHPSRSIGIDVEQVRHHETWTEMAAMLWPDIVIKQIRCFPVHEQSREFLNQWCQYEATAKALGLGLSAQGVNWASEKPCQLWKLLLPEGYLGYAAML
jgi:4'-phosphopantetheinyl transferase